MRLSNLEAERARHNMTNGDLAKLIGVTEATILSKKKDPGKFTKREMEQICNYFNCTIEYLFAETDDTLTQRHYAPNVVAHG